MIEGGLLLILPIIPPIIVKTYYSKNLLYGRVKTISILNIILYKFYIKLLSFVYLYNAIKKEKHGKTRAFMWNQL